LKLILRIITYLTDMLYVICWGIDNFVTCRVPQGSLRGPLLFVLHVSKLLNIVEIHLYLMLVHLLTMHVSFMFYYVWRCVATCFYVWRCVCMATMRVSMCNNALLSADTCDHVSMCDSLYLAMCDNVLLIVTIRYHLLLCVMMCV
jgi:hypothetical protein